MTIEELLRTTGEALTVRRVFGEPVKNGDTVLVPVCTLAGGGGGGSGSGTGDGDSGEGSGGGWGMRATPAGAYRISPTGEVTWHPAVNVNRIVLGAQTVLALVAVAAWALGRRDRRHR